MWPFTRKPSLERRLEGQYAEMLGTWGLPKGHAKRTARQLVAMARQQARSDPNLPPNFGLVLIERETTDDSIREMLAGKRAEGVTDADIKWWWGLDNIEQRLFIVVDDWCRVASFKKYCAEGLTEEQAIAQLRKAYPIFGDPKDARDVKGDDRPLPFELKNRVSKWADVALGKESVRDASQQPPITSMNALVRSEIRAGRL